jgi:hypothetical protein
MAPFAGFISGSYQSRSLQADAERSINWYPEALETRSGRTKTSDILLSKPGFATFATLTGTTAVRAACALNGRGFVVAVNGASNAFYELHADGSSTSYGALPGDRRPQLCASQSQILILAGGLGYIFDLTANTLTRITAAAFPIGATKAGFLDGYFVVLEPNSQVFALSALNDGTQWAALDFGDAEGEPGNVVTFLVDHRQLWFLATTHGEIYYNSGNANFPMTRLDGAFMEQGASSVDGAFQCDNTIFWQGGNRDGQGVFWRAAGYTPQRISTHAIEFVVSTFGDISDSSGYAYQEDGHTFARWDFPSAYGGRGAALLYDVGEKFWHERYFWNATLGQYLGDLARCHMFVFGMHLVGDWRSGTIYEQSMKYNSDAGAAIRRLRAAPDLANGGKFTFYGEMRLLAEVGIGLDGPALPPPASGATWLGSSTGSTVTPGNRTTLSANLSIPGPPSGGAVSSYVTFALNVAAYSGGSPEPIGTVGTWTGTFQAGESALLPYSETISGQVAQNLLLQPALPLLLTDTLAVSLTSQSTTPPLTSPTLVYDWLMAPANLATGLFLNTSTATNGTVFSTALLSFTQAVVSLLWATNNSPTGVYETPPAGSSLTVTLQAAGAAASAPIVLTAANPVQTVVFGSPITVAPGTNACLFTTAPLVAGGAGFGLLAITLTGPGGVPLAPGFPSGGAPCGDGTNPQMIQQISNDGGRTWSAERARPLGKIGDFRRLLRWNQNGRSNNRAIRVICSEPVPVALVACDLDSTNG